jgi:hypothetical protein
MRDCLSRTDVEQIADIPKERFDRIPHESFPKGERARAERLRGLDPEVRAMRRSILRSCGPYYSRPVPSDEESIQEATARVEARRIADEAEQGRRLEKYGWQVEAPAGKAI